jgi:hypothetical protein
MPQNMETVNSGTHDPGVNRLGLSALQKAIWACCRPGYSCPLKVGVLVRFPVSYFDRDDDEPYFGPPNRMIIYRLVGRDERGWDCFKLAEELYRDGSWCEAEDMGHGTLRIGRRLGRNNEEMQ